MSALEGLRDEQLQMVQTFCDATGEEDPEHAARVLGQNGWDLNVGSSPRALPPRLAPNLTPSWLSSFHRRQ